MHDSISVFKGINIPATLKILMDLEDIYVRLYVFPLG